MTLRVQEPQLAHLAPEVAPFFTGYRIDLEPRTEIEASLATPTQVWKTAVSASTWERPKEIDPRAWFDIHNQGNQGSCQGQSLADSGEYSVVIAAGEEVQLSRSYAYFTSQEYDGLIGRDNGSTLQGGTKAIRDGLPLESVLPYSDNYRSALSNYQSQKSSIKQGPLYKCRGAVQIKTAVEAQTFLGGWTGSIQIGIDWSVRLVDGWEIQTYRPGNSGGHASLICGYLKVARWASEGGFGLLLKNSHSTQWGKNGWALVKPSAFDSMMGARWGVGIGRSDMEVPRPRVERVDNYRTIMVK